MNDERQKLENYAKRERLSPNLPVVDAVEKVEAAVLAVGELVKSIDIPEPLPFPEIPAADFSLTNELLKKILEKEGEEVTIEVKLELE